MEIVVNEWLLDYLRPDAQSDEISLAIRFINAWVEKCDKVAIRRTSPFTRKFYKYMGEFGWDITFKERFSKLNDLLFRNLEKTIILDEPEVMVISENLAPKIPTKDKYLVELWYSVPGSIVVTTDSTLKNKLIEYDSSAKIYLLKEFLPTYVPHK